MVSKVHSLPRQAIRNALSRGKKFTSGRLRLLVLQAETSSGIGLAVVVSRGIDKRATARNRMRRLLTESFRRLSPRISKNWDIVCIVIGALPQTQIETQRIVETLLAEARVL